ncbi:hypothetical protein BLNAU_1906 [Blattamonas nauphoetae]|uniref:Uncharacterized protein n=1 Tax=Blattamonas nauphoetae TaxID=2049346 RepID=A0ABQ9YI03_9EUKA|nr:hypothetical protein BLNAU_1906 [Blattamonas nauphoetae]
MEMLVNLLWLCSAKVQLSLVKADLIPQLINALNPQSLSFAETKDINLHLMRIIFNSLWLAIPNGLEQLGIEDENEQQDVHETILKQVVAPSEQYIWHLCVTRYLIIDGDLSSVFVRLLARLLQICPYYQPTRKFVLHMPVFLTIPSYFSFFEDERSICSFLDEMICTQRECNDKGGEYRQMWKKVLRMLRMEGIEDVMEEKLRNHKNRFFGGRIVAESIGLTNFLGMNL